MLENFEKHWKACNGEIEEQRRLIKLIVEWVYVQDEAVVAMTLKADYHIVLGHNANGSTEISIDPSLYMCGDDGHKSLARIRGILLIPPYALNSHTSLASLTRQIIHSEPDRLVLFFDSRGLPVYHA
jgi:hypothetical protein